MRKPVSYGTASPHAVLQAVGRMLSEEGHAHVKLAQAKAVEKIYSPEATAHDPGELVYAIAHRLIEAVDGRAIPFTQKRPQSP